MRDHLAEDPDSGLRLMTRLARRLTTLSERVGGPEPSALTRDALAAASGPRWLRWLGRLLPGRRRSNAGAMWVVSASRLEQPLRLVVASLPNDDGDAQRARLLAALEPLGGISVKGVSRAVEVTNEDDPLTALAQAGRQARALLDRENADLVVWGLVDPAAALVELHFTGLAQADDDRPGLPHALTWLALPLDFGPEWTPLVRAITLAAIEPRGEGQASSLLAVLPAAVEDARPLGLEPPAGFGPAEQTAILSCYGHACAALGHLARDTVWSETAVDAYGTALGLLPPDADLEWAFLHRSIGLALQGMGERTDSLDALTRAAEAYRGALDALPRAEHPRDWAGLQVRLGMVLYKHALLDGAVESLKEPLQCLQGAMQLFTRAEHPGKWADLMNTISQVLQVYGDHMRSVAILERAVDACKQALSVRTYEAAPLAWAATQNTLGSALFLLAKHAQKRAPLEDAAEAFRKALGTYRMMSLERAASVAESNLRRVEDMLKRTTGPRLLADPAWAERPGAINSRVDWDPVSAAARGARRRAEKEDLDEDEDEPDKGDRAAPSPSA
ncbi:tetratricopeptide repeat protein [Pararhodospirillum photometricum]|uniref:Cyclic nucleotide-binding domain (CNMP-BD) protein n=1 Tax=Pararhodospirillum photometricum DSM 122 TaxID=1150469 RepID=H6SPV5_PARPM|nr:tetratricopeptide repeat protein [Pararhodospirillum photometricum]CCG07225.1 Cyclic nucleotide-binding domain (CNMP-BD) protein [Pararhodospirillum photometricum DSM 122]